MSRAQGQWGPTAAPSLWTSNIKNISFCKFLLSKNIYILCFLYLIGSVDVFCHCEISGSHGSKYEVYRLFWDVAPCSHVEVDRGFRGMYCLHHRGDRSKRHWAVITYFWRRKFAVSCKHFLFTQKEKSEVEHLNSLCSGVLSIIRLTILAKCYCCVVSLQLERKL
jgi:hypothetical protein